MMKLHVFSYNKKAISLQQFAKNVNTELMSAYILHADIVEDTNTGNCLLYIVTDSTRQATQELVFVGINPLHLVENDINFYLGSLKNKSLKAINIVPMSGGRAIGLILSEDLGIENDGNEVAGKEAKRKRNKRADEGSDAGTKS